MQDQVNATPTPLKRVPCNKGKVIGAKPPLRPKHVWSIRTKLKIEGRARDLAMFNLAIDSKLRDCDVVAIKVEDVAASGSSSSSPKASTFAVSRGIKASTRLRDHSTRCATLLAAASSPSGDQSVKEADTRTVGITHNNTNPVSTAIRSMALGA